MIRKGKKDDCAALLSLIQELADYENAHEEVTLTLEDLIEDGFGVQPLFEFLVAELEGKIVGIALYYPRYSTWKGETLYLEDLVIQKKHRGKKIGTALFDKLLLEAKKRKVKRLEWQVLNWNEPALNFYKKYQASFDGEWINGRLTDVDIDALIGEE